MAVHRFSEQKQGYVLVARYTDVYTCRDRLAHQIFNHMILQLTNKQTKAGASTTKILMRPKRWEVLNKTAKR